MRTLVVLISQLGFIFCCNTYKVQYLSSNNSIFEDKKLDTENWNQVAVLFGWTKNGDIEVTILKDSGSQCGSIDRFDFISKLGPGMGITPLHSGFVACGGKNNVRGKCCFWKINSLTCDTIETDGATVFTGSVLMTTDMKWTSLQDRVVIFDQGSGKTLIGDFSSESTVLVWHEVPTPDHFPVQDPCIVMDRKKLYIIGGKNNQGFNHVGMWVLDTTKIENTESDWKYVKTFPPISVSNGACLVDKQSGHLWHFGGLGKSGEILSESFVYDIQANESKKGVTWDASYREIQAVQLDEDSGLTSRTFIIGITVEGFAKVDEINLDKNTVTSDVLNISETKIFKDLSYVPLPMSSLPPECLDSSSLSVVNSIIVELNPDKGSGRKNDVNSLMSVYLTIAVCLCLLRA